MTEFKFIRHREKMPNFRKEKNGVFLMCPFCNPSHTIVPGVPSTCGVVLKVTAIQPVIGARSVKKEKLICAKCGKGGGEMVQYFNGFVHLKDCKPDLRLITEIPPYSRFAKFIYGFHPTIRSLLEKFTGTVQIVREITPDGVQSGEIQGYFFLEKVKIG